MNQTELEALLAGAFPSLRPARLNGLRGPWSLSPAGGGPYMGIAVDTSWALLQMNADRARAGAALDTLSSQSAWPGGVKHGETAGRPLLRADVPLLMDTSVGRAWVERQLRACFDGILIAAGQDACSKERWQDDRILQDPEFLAFACAAGGWNAAVKPDGTVRFDLQVRGAHRSVVLQAGEAGIRASVTLAAGALGRASVPCRAAAGHFLMRASTALRWARAFASRQGDQVDSAGFECFIAAPPDEQALLLAVDTLIAACELFGREAEVLLEHQEIAARYMECASGIDRESEDDSLSTAAAAPRAAVLSHAAHAAIV